MAKKSAEEHGFEKVLINGEIEHCIVKPISMMDNNGIVIRDRMPILEILYEKIIRAMYPKLTSFTRTKVTTWLIGSNIKKYGEFVNELQIPSMILSIKSENFSQGITVALSPPLFENLCVAALGGITPARGDMSEPTTVDYKMFEDLSNIIINSFNKSFSDVFREHHKEFTKESVEINPQMLGACSPSSDVMITELEIQLNGTKGSIYIIMPYESLLNSSVSFSSSFVRPSKTPSIGLQIDKDAIKAEVFHIAQLEEINVKKLKTLKEGGILKFKELINKKSVQTKLSTEGDSNGY